MDITTQQTTPVYVYGSANRQVTRSDIESTLVGDPLTEGYRPTLPMWTLYALTADWIPQFYLLRDIELMMIHPVVLSRLNYFKSGVAGADFDVECNVPEASEFIYKHCHRYWDRGVPKIQGGYEYGWIGCEPLYTDEGGRLEWTDMVQFSPRDVFLLTRASKPVGVRVKQIRTDASQRVNQEIEDQDHTGRVDHSRRPQGHVDLFMATRDVPAKGLWYAHNPRYSQFYGQSQLLGAWRPWRRLAWKDGAETNIDGGFYRFFYAGPLVKYPSGDEQAPSGVTSPAVTLDSQGKPRRYNRDVARQIAELYKSGAGVGLPSEKYPPEWGGGDKWSVEIPKSTLNIDGGINYVKHLWDQISYGVGVPPELFSAGETGSGYSGRAIPLESFLTMQQHIADALLALFCDQILYPLVRWNWGNNVRFEVKVKNLLQMKRMAQQGMAGNAKQPSQNGTWNPKDYENRIPGRPLVPGQRDQGTAPQANGTPDNGWTGLSLNPLTTDRTREITRKILRAAA